MIVHPIYKPKIIKKIKINVLSSFIHNPTWSYFPAKNSSSGVGDKINKSKI